MNKDLFSEEKLKNYLEKLNLHNIKEQYKALASMAEKENFRYVEYLWELITQEYEDKKNKRINRFLKESCLPLEKTWDSFDKHRLSDKLKQKVHCILEGTFLKNKENILVFGNTGTGKRHLLSAIGQELIRKGHRIYFADITLFIQELLAAKEKLNLANCIKRFNKYEAIILNNIGYVQQSVEGMEVLFTFLDARYERSSMMIASNTSFSSWEKMFKDSILTTAIIDRLVHHSIILELNLKSYRMQSAKEKEKEGN